MKIKFGWQSIAFEINDYVDQGVQAEEVGLHSVWIPDHFTDVPPSNDIYEPWTVLAAIGAKTEKILLGTLATDSTRRHPASLAHVVVTLDNLSRGRVILGLGAGEAFNILPYGLPWEDKATRLDRLEECVNVIRKLWKSSQASPLNFHGRFYNLEGARLDLHPYGDRRLPIYIAVMGTRRSLQLTGKIGDGWLPWFNTPETFVEKTAIIDRAAEQMGRSPDQIEKTAVVYLALTSDPGKQKYLLDSIKPEIVILMSAGRLAKFGYIVDSGGSTNYSYQRCLASDEDAKRAYEMGAKVPDSVASKFLVTGSSRACIDRIEELASAGARHIIFRNLLWLHKLEDVRITLDRVGKDIIPSFS